MEEYIRDGYTFIGPKAADSVKYYDLVISHGYSVDMHFLALDAAHKFGSKVIGHGGAYSLRGGWVEGENAEEAAEYIDAEWKKHYAACPEFNRSKLMREKMQTVYKEAEEKYGVRINNACCP